MRVPWYVYMSARLQEASTWRGLVWVLTAVGVTVSPEAAAHVVALGTAVAGVLGMVLADSAGGSNVPH